MLNWSINLNDKGDDSAPHTPTSPTGSHVSLAMSISSTSTIPIVTSDKQIVLAMSPGRPKLASMQTKLDFTKFDATLYEQVSKLEQLKTVTI